jgi:hypothetical protein
MAKKDPAVLQPYIMKTKAQMEPQEKLDFESRLQREFTSHMDDTKQDLQLRVAGVAMKNGATGYQFAGYTRLERFYRGDQWFANEPTGASQRTDNYCAVIVDNISSLVFDDIPEINCIVDDPSDDLASKRAELKEDLIMKVWKDNDFEVEFDSWAKSASLYGDGFLKGPWMEKVNQFGEPIAQELPGSWKIRFSHVENPGSIRPIWADTQFKRLLGFIDESRISPVRAEMLYGAMAKARGISLQPTIKNTARNRQDPDTYDPMVNIQEYWTSSYMAVFVNYKLLDFYVHNWKFIPLNHVKNIYSPNWPYGKSDLEDVIDPQLSHNRTNNDLANLLRWVSSINLWGKNLEGMQALVAGLSRIYSLPEDGEIHAFEKTGDAYISSTYALQRRSAIIEISGVSDQLLSSSQTSDSSGRALALAFQGTIRKLNPRMKRFRSAMQDLNSKILRLYEIYYPEVKVVIKGDYRNEVFIASTLTQNIVDTINKLQSGIISLQTAQHEAGINQPKKEQKLIKKFLADPVLGPQIARQPQLLPKLQPADNQPGDSPMPTPGNQPSASPEGSVAAQNSQASGAAPVPVVAGSSSAAAQAFKGKRK